MSLRPILQPAPVKSSLGFHTLLLSLKLTYKDAKKLLDRFYKYNEDTGRLLIYEDGKHEPVERYVDGKTYYETKMSYRIKFKGEEDKGFEWV